MNLEELKKLCDAATTPGDWVIFPKPNDVWADATFVAAAQAALPKLIALAEAVKKIASDRWTAEMMDWPEVEEALKALEYP